MGWLLLALAALAVGCFVRPLRVPTNFLVDDELVAEALREAIAEWTAAGSVDAAKMTVNGPGDGVPVTRTDRRDLWRRCAQPETYAGDGCSYHDGRQWTGIWIPTELVDYDRLRVVMLHELGHVLTGQAGHLPSDRQAVMALNGTSDRLTPDDVWWAKLYAPFDES